jgi:hypothetical protein
VLGKGGATQNQILCKLFHPISSHISALGRCQLTRPTQHTTAHLPDMIISTLSLCTTQTPPDHHRARHHGHVCALTPHPRFWSNPTMHVDVGDTKQPSCISGNPSHALGCMHSTAPVLGFQVEQLPCMHHKDPSVPTTFGHAHASKTRACMQDGPSPPSSPNRWLPPLSFPSRALVPPFAGVIAIKIKPELSLILSSNHYLYSLTDTLPSVSYPGSSSSIEENELELT